MIRSASFAGTFYPADKEEILEQLAEFNTEEVANKEALGIIVPHAGYIYSGKTAFCTYQKVTPKKTAIILAPNHSGSGESLALYGKGYWRTPLGTVEIDNSVGNLLLEEIKELKNDYLAHEAEHSLEVQLPLIQFFSQETKIVPILCKHLSFSLCQKIGQQIAKACANLPEKPLIIASTDMTHYQNAEVTVNQDRQVIDKILQLNEEATYQLVKEKEISMCGIIPTTIMLSAAKQLGATKAELVRYSHSGEINGDHSRVVGYAGIIVS